MTLLKTILEVFHRSIMRIGRQMCLKILDMCGGVIFNSKPHTHFLNNLCSQNKFFLTFEHLYIITAWFLIEFSERNDNGNVCLKFYSYLVNYCTSQHGNRLCCRLYSCKAKCCWSKYKYCKPTNFRVLLMFAIFAFI